MQFKSRPESLLIYIPFSCLLHSIMNKKYPSFQDLQKSINSFKATDLASSSIISLKDDFLKLITNFAFMPIIIPKLVKMHRIRINDDGKEFDMLNELWCPPVDVITKLGRCNDVGDQILYMSGGGHTALNEINPKDGDLVTCLECELVENITVIDLGASNNLQREAYLQQYSRLNKNAAFIFYKNQNLLKLDKILKNYIIKEFTQKVDSGQEYLYKKTVAISKAFFEAPNIEGIMFPSIKSELKELNYAIPILFANKCLKPTRVDVFRMEYNDRFKKIGFRVLKGCYSNLNFSEPIKYGLPKPIERWATKQDI